MFPLHRKVQSSITHNCAGIYQEKIDKCMGVSHKSIILYTLVKINKLHQEALTVLHFTNVEQNNTDTEEFMFHDIIHSTFQSMQQ